MVVSVSVVVSVAEADPVKLPNVSDGSVADSVYTVEKVVRSALRVGGGVMVVVYDAVSSSDIDAVGVSPLGVGALSEPEVVTVARSVSLDVIS